MKYLKISNKGELDIRLISLMGGTTKADNPNKIGQFGTGLKYAISWLVRNENKFRMFIGTEEIIFETRDEIISDHEFKEIYCNGKSMSITTRYGYQWKCWEAIREIWCNAKDEGSEQKKETSENSIISGIAGRTTFYIEITEEITSVIESWDKYFLIDKPLFECEKYGIYLNTGKGLKLYKNRVLIYQHEETESLFCYDLKQSELNELRQYMGYYMADIGRSLLSSSKEVISLYLENLNTNKNNVESRIDFQYLSYDVNHIKEIFEGYLFLHPESSRSKSNKAIKVGKSLFKILQDCDLPTEKIYSRGGSYYGGRGSGYYENEEVLYQEVENSLLNKRIQNVLDKYKSELNFSVVVPVDSDFEIMTDEYNDVVFSSDLQNQSDSDLESTVLVGIFHSKEGNLFKALKRLIKFALSNRAFEKIFFGSK